MGSDKERNGASTPEERFEKLAKENEESQRRVQEALRDLDEVVEDLDAVDRPPAPA